jgi:hypothetical protein
MQMDLNSYHLRLNTTEFQYCTNQNFQAKIHLVGCFVSKKSFNPNLDKIMKALEPYHNYHPKFLQSTYSLYL